MQAPDDQPFESYLQQFRPVSPQALSDIGIVKRPRSVRLAGLVATAAALAVLGTLLLRVHTDEPIVSGVRSGHPIVDLAAEPLTVRNANAYLWAKPSIEDALNEMAFRSQSKHLGQGKQSALAELSKERIKL